MPSDPGSPTYSLSSASISDPAVVIETDDISNYNPDQILPEPPEEIRNIRRWLSPTDYSNDSGEYQRHLASHLPGTGAWVTSSDEYLNWLQSDEAGILWIKGIPGSGKSVLAAQIVDELARSHPTVPVLYFFFRQIIDANHKPDALLRDWLDQILDYSPPLQKRLKELIETGRSIESITMEDQWANLKLAFNGLVDRVFCVADALDEMDQGNDEFLRSLVSLGNWRPSKAKILMTSRPVLSVEAPLRQSRFSEIRLVESCVDVDITSYVEHGLKETNIPESDQQHIKEAIPGRANGLFLYAKLAMDAFLEPGANIDQVLLNLPSDLNDMYTRLLREHAHRSRVPSDVQLLILQWITHATRPLRLLELAEMVDVTHHFGSTSDLKAKKGLVRAATGPLLEILPDETVCVIHHSFTEYLTRMQDSGENETSPVLRLGPTHGRLALACLAYLQTGCLDMVQILPEENTSRDYHADSWYEEIEFGFQEPEKEQEIRLKHPFYAYAVRNWHVHIVKSTLAGAPQAEIDLAIESFLSNDKRRESWLVLKWASGRKAVGTKAGLQSINSLHIAARFGLASYAAHLISTKTGIGINAKDTQGRTPLWWAAFSGHGNIIRLLFKAGAEPDTDDLVSGLKPLHTAASQNHAEAVSALLESGVDPLTKKTREDPGRFCGNAPTSTGHTALMYACQMGHSEALNAFVPFLQNLETIHRALVWSASAGRARLVDRLLQIPGVDVDTRVRGNTALVEACRVPSRDTIIRLLDAGADPTLLCENLGDEFRGMELEGLTSLKAPTKERGFTALHALCQSPVTHYRSTLDSNDWHELVTRLIGQGKNVNQQNHNGSTALHMAVNTPVAVRLLLDAGADANSLDDYGMTPLHSAKSPDSISLLVETGRADLNVREDRDGSTPLHILLQIRLKEVILQLLEYGPDLSISDHQGNSALHVALKYGDVQPEVIKALLAAGANPNGRNTSGQTPLMLLNMDGTSFIPVLDILLETGGDINAKDSVGDTLLSRTLGRNVNADSGTEFIDALVSRGADIQTRDFAGKTLLHRVIAACGSSITPKGDKTVERLQYLLEKGLSVHSIDYQGNSLLHELSMRLGSPGAFESAVKIAERLLDLDVDINQQNHSGRTVLHIMADSTKIGCDDTVFNLLLSRTNFNQRDNLGLSALHLASTFSEHNTKLLLDAGADPTVRSYDGFTPLHLAARARQSNVVGQLLQALGTKIKNFLDVEDVRGYTPLYYACKAGRPETVRLLIDAGADASRKHLFAACADFEAEDALWQAEPQKGKLGLAAGLTFSDKTRPISAFNSSETSQTWNTLHRDQSTARLEEILDMLMENGGDPSNLHSQRPMNVTFDFISSTYSSSDYTSTCLAWAKKRWRVDSKSDAPFEEHFALQEVTPAEQDAIDNLKENEANTGLVLDFLRKRKYHAMRIMFQRGLNFLDGTNADDRTGPPLGIFAHNGFSTLLRQIGKLEADHRKEQGRWHAFGDASKAGLYSKPDLTTPETRSWRHSFLLYEAAKNPLPNLDVLRVLVEELHVDVNEALYTKVYNARTQKYEERPAGTVLHYLAKGLHWWHVFLAIPYLLKKGADVNALTYEDRSPLHDALGFATGPFRYEAAKAFISAGADVNATDTDGNSCLSYASTNAGMVKLLVANGARVGADALFSAIKINDVKLLETLLSFGADPNAPRAIERETSDRYPLQYAIRYQREHVDMRKSEGKTDTLIRVVEVLLAHGADPFGSWERERPNNSRRGNRYEIKDENFDTRHSAVLTPEIDDDQRKSKVITLLHNALETGNIVHPILKLAGLDPDFRDAMGRTVLHAACLSHVGVCSPIDALFTTNMERQSSSPSFLDHLLGIGADISKVDNHGRNILHLSLTPAGYLAKDVPPVIELIKYASGAHKYLLNQPDNFGLTPLHLAVRLAASNTGRLSALALALLDAGADPFAVDKNMNTMLHIAAYNADHPSGFRDLCEKLLQLDLDINAKNAFGETPIFNLNKVHPDYGYVFSMFQREKILTYATESVAMFEKAGADLFATDNEGRNLLHIAASCSLPDSASRFEALLKKGLDPTAEDNLKRTALDVAAAYNKTNILKLFNKDNMRNQVTAEEIENDGLRAKKHLWE